MKLKDIVRLLDARILTKGADLEMEVRAGGAADLMSDVLALSKPKIVLLTGLTTIQAIYTAEMAGISVVCIVRGKPCPQEMINLAEEKGIVLISTNYHMYDSCGILYNNGLSGEANLK